MLNLATASKMATGARNALLLSGWQYYEGAGDDSEAALAMAYANAERVKNA